MNIVLTGFMASGKSTISKELSRLMNYSLIDTDLLIEKNEKTSINKIFEEKGEAIFRKIEHDIICKVSTYDNVVISTGGGVPLNSENIKELRKNGVIVYLNADFQTIKERLESARATRPLLKNNSIDEIKERYDSRQKYYLDCDYKIDISNAHSPVYYAEEIMKLIQQ